MTGGVWRDPPESTDDYPGLRVTDNVCVGSVNFEGTRLGLWAILADWTRSGWADTADAYNIEAEERVAAGFLYHLLNIRGDFARLLCVLADVERRESERQDHLFDTAPDGGPVGFADQWWEHPPDRDRVAKALRDCLDRVTV